MSFLGVGGVVGGVFGEDKSCVTWRVCYFSARSKFYRCRLTIFNGITGEVIKEVELRFIRS